MIERYSRPKMTNLWSLEAQFRTWMDIEVLACEGWAKLGKIPKADIENIRTKANFNTEEVLALERETRHDMAAFVSNMQKYVGESGRFIHLGMTSSDVVDTAFAYRLTKSADVLLEELEPLLKLTKEKAQEHKNVPMMGRTHGIHAEPVTFGMKWLYWHDMLKRSKARLQAAREEVAVGKISGAVGHYAHLPPQIEAHVCEKLGLKPDTFSTQVISRDRFATYFCALGMLGSVVENIAVELRHLQRTEVGEVREGFKKGQKGSSAMPHKRNPITAENLTGLGRLLRGYVVPALENVALWHERDISHSSVERVIAPDANILADYMLGRLYELLSGLEAYPERMKENLESLHGVVFSQQLLLKLIEKGMSRDDAYQIVQRTALQALDQKQPLLSLLKNEKKVGELLKPQEIEAIFDPKSFYTHLEYLYEKVLTP